MLIKIMVFNTKDEADKAEKEICHAIGRPEQCWIDRGMGEKNHAVPVKRADGKWIFVAPTMGWCRCVPSKVDEHCDPTGKGICENAVHRVVVDYIIEEMDRHEYNILQDPSLDSIPPEPDLGV